MLDKNNLLSYITCRKDIIKGFEMALIRKPFNKKMLVAISSGVAAAVIFCFGIKQCTDKESAYAERDAAKTKTEQVVKEVNDVVGRANVVIDSLRDENSALRREIHECDTVSGNLVDEVNALNDSISSLNESLQDAARKLEDAQKQKVRPAGRRTQPRKQKITGPGAPEKVRRATRRMPGTPRVQVVGGDEVVVQRPGQGTVVVGDGNAVVVGNGNTVVVNANREKVNAATDTLKQYSVTITRQWIGKRRVK